MESSRPSRAAWPPSTARRFAWIKAGKLTEEQFAAWHKAAKARKKDRDREVISLDEFKAWMRDS